jgi:dipeptidyl aminopeptidase/acylaminoacyl peptidase
MSSPTSPTRTVLRDGHTGAIVRELGTADDSAWKAAGYADPELFQGVAADGKTPIQGMILRPAHMDPALHYPVIDNVYTGPTTTDVPATFSDAHRVTGNGVAQLGAIVVMIDGRGTSRHGQAFRLPAFQNLGEVGLDDHIALIRQMAARYPYMDVTRVGVYGGSAGAMMRRASCCAGRSSSRWASHPRAITNCGWTRHGGPRFPWGWPTMRHGIAIRTCRWRKT